MSRPSRNLQWTALVLRTSRIGEIHRGLTLLTRESGLRSAIAHGANSGRGRLRGVTDPFTLGSFYVYHDPVKDSTKVTDVDVKSFFHGLRESLERYTTASLWAEIVLRTHGGVGEPLFDFIVDAIAVLEAAQDSQVPLVLAQFLWRYLELSGLKPGVEVCSDCGRRLDPSFGAHLSFDHSGFVCPSCAHGEAPRVLPGALAYIGHTERLDFREAVGVTLARDALDGLKSILLRLLEHNIGTRLTVPSILDGLV